MTLELINSLLGPVYTYRVLLEIIPAMLENDSSKHYIISFLGGLIKKRQKSSNYDIKFFDNKNCRVRIRVKSFLLSRSGGKCTGARG